MFSARQIVRGLHGRGVTVYIDRRGVVSTKLNANCYKHRVPLTTDDFSHIKEFVHQHEQKLLAYFTSLPYLCGSTPFGHDGTCFSNATHTAELCRLQIRVISTANWYYCGTHLPPKKKLVDLGCKLYKLETF